MAALTSGASAEDIPVDLELVLAVDVSHSVDLFEGRLQRNGYVRAFYDQEVIDAILGGPIGSIAVTYVEWAGTGAWRIVADWQIIDSVGSSRAFAVRLAQSQAAFGQNTSITFLIQRAIALFDGNGIEGTRRVIDISGDGPNNTGGIVSEARDEAVAAGLTINGLAINNSDGSPYSLPDLDVYYEECVVGGPGAFVIAADDFESFAAAIRRKLIQEIAGLTPTMMFATAIGDVLGRSEPKYAPACDIGERMRFGQTFVPLPAPDP